MNNDNGSGDKKTPRRSSSGRKTGYRNPPREHCFRPGQSGNPHGRPRGSKNKFVIIDDERLNDIILEEAFRDVNVRQGDRVLSMPVIHVTIKTMAAKAASGNMRAAQHLYTATDRVLRRQKALHDEYRDTVANYIREAWAEIAERKAKGLSTDHIVPHPDDFMWDADSAMPYLRDPATEPMLEENKEQLELLDSMIRRVEEMMKNETDPAKAAGWRTSLAKLHAYRKILEGKIKSQSAKRTNPGSSSK